MKNSGKKKAKKPERTKKSGTSDDIVANNIVGKFGRVLGADEDYYEDLSENNDRYFSPNNAYYWVFIAIALFFAVYPNVTGFFDTKKDMVANTGTKKNIVPVTEQNLKIPSGESERPHIDDEKTPESINRLLTKVENLDNVNRLYKLFYLFPKVLDEIPSTMPLYKKNSVLTSHYGLRKHPIHRITKNHFGIDLAAAIGSDVFATASGEVEAATLSSKGHGNHVVIVHPNGFKTLYAHLDSFSVKKGDIINAQQLIGKVGTTGQSTGPHLHYEIIKNGVHIDPMPSFNLKHTIYKSLK